MDRTVTVCVVIRNHHLLTLSRLAQVHLHLLDFRMKRCTLLAGLQFIDFRGLLGQWEARFCSISFTANLKYKFLVKNLHFYYVRAFNFLCMTKSTRRSPYTAELIRSSSGLKLNTLRRLNGHSPTPLAHSGWQCRHISTSTNDSQTATNDNNLNPCKSMSTWLGPSAYSNSHRPTPHCPHVATVSLTLRSPYQR